MTDPSLGGQEGAPAGPDASASIPEPAATPAPEAVAGPAPGPVVPEPEAVVPEPEAVAGPAPVQPVAAAAPAPAAPAQGWGAPAAPVAAPAAPAQGWGAPAAPAPAQAQAPVVPGPVVPGPAAPAPTVPAEGWGAPAAPAAPTAPAPAAPAWGAPAAPTWGAPVPAPGGTVPGWSAPALAPVPLPGPRGSSGMRTTILSAVIMIGVVFGVNVVNAAVPLPSDPTTVNPAPVVPVDPNPPTQDPNQPTQDPNQPTPQPPPTTGPVNPGPVAPGTELKVGAGVVVFPPDGWTVVGSDNGVTVLTKGGVVMIVAGLQWGGTPLELATGYRDSWFEGGQFRSSDPEAGSVGNGIPGAALSYSGILDGNQVEGIIVTGVSGGAGVVFNVFGAQGSLNGVSNDINALFGTIQFTGDPG